MVTPKHSFVIAKPVSSAPNPYYASQAPHHTSENNFLPKRHVTFAAGVRGRRETLSIKGLIMSKSRQHEKGSGTTSY